jgi:hypothetical protein
MGFLVPLFLPLSSSICLFVMSTCLEKSMSVCNMFVFQIGRSFCSKILSMGSVADNIVHSGTCLITISVDQCLNSQPGPSSSYSSLSLSLSLSLSIYIYIYIYISVCVCGQYHFCPDIAFCSAIVLSSIVGNPLICGSGSIEGCSVSVTLVPPSFSLESSPGNVLKLPPLVLNHLFLFPPI